MAEGQWIIIIAGVAGPLLTIGSYLVFGGRWQGLIKEKLDNLEKSIIRLTTEIHETKQDLSKIRDVDVKELYVTQGKHETRLDILEKQINNK